MFKNKTNQKLFALVSIVMLLSLATVVSSASAIISQNATSWFWVSDTNISTVAFGDVNGDGQNELVSAGYYNDGFHWIGILEVWDPQTMVMLAQTAWLWGTDTQVSSVALANITGGKGLDIVTGGAIFDGTRWIAQLLIWNGTTLGYERGTAWYWASNTEIGSVAVANLTGSASLDIVTGGAYFDGTRWNGQLVVWNATTLAAERWTNWAWVSDTYVNSVAIGNMTGDTSLSIVTGGTEFDGTRNVAQLLVWNGSTLATQSVAAWYWGSDTEINTVAVGNITGGTSLDIVTGGDYFDGTRNVAQLVVWNSTGPAVERLTTWYDISSTKITSLALGNFTGGSSLDIIAGGVFNDTTRNNAEVIVWNGSSLVTTSKTTWFTTSNTMANSVGVGNIANFGPRIFAGGQYWDGTRSVAQITVWQ